MTDIVANMLTNIKNADLQKQNEVLIQVNGLLKEILLVLKEEKYIKDYELTKTTRGEFAKVTLAGKINYCASIKPRSPFNKQNYIWWEQRYLLAKDLGRIILSTSRGIITHIQAKQKGIGGIVVAVVY